jgi:N-ethylmaleimide reductase
LASLQLKNRIIMAPLTRSRAGGPAACPTPDGRVLRAARLAGLIMSEATAVTPQGVGYADTPGIWSDEQVEGWKHITKAVHDAGGLIVLQLWHVGRISAPVFLMAACPWHRAPSSRPAT